MAVMDSLSILAMAAAAVQRSEMMGGGLQFGPDFTIRQPRSSDIPLLEGVERSAAQLFKTAGLDFLVDGPTVTPWLLASMATAGNLWIAADRFDRPVGFLGGHDIEENFHVVEMSVAQEYQGKGIGKALVLAMVGEARRQGYKAITLTTYKNLPWNAPWYTRMGFFEEDVAEMGRDYIEIMEMEAQQGLAPKDRCVMRKIL